jgi:hypothetical protein
MFLHPLALLPIALLFLQGCHTQRGWRRVETHEMADSVAAEEEAEKIYADNELEVTENEPQEKKKKRKFQGTPIYRIPLHVGHESLVRTWGTGKEIVFGAGRGFRENWRGLKRAARMTAYGESKPKKVIDESHS